MRHPENRRRLLLILLAVAHGACGWGAVRRVDYSVRPIAVAPFGSTVTDRSKPFADTFCATLPHTAGNWGACGAYLETQVPLPPPVSSEIKTPLKVFIVGGAFSECFDNKNLFVYDKSLDHLREHGVVFGERLHVGGTNTPEENAKAIAKYLDTYPGDYIAIGHSKGAVDLMAAIQGHDNARRQIKVLVSVAGAIGGSRLADLGVKLGIQGFQDAVLKSGLGRCEIVDHGGIESLSRKVRYEALRQWHPPQSLRTYSLVAVSSKLKTSKPLHTMWERNAYYSIDQDSHIIAEEAIIPGSEFLGIVNADHWAIALPMSEHPLTKDKVDQNPFPRTALLEAIVRYVTTANPGR